MSKIVHIVHNAVVAQALNPQKEVRLLLMDILSYEVDTTFMNNANWDGKASMFDMRNNQFPAGFVRMVRKKLERLGYKVLVSHRPIPEALGEERPIVNSFGYTDKYDYQPMVADRLVEMKRMIAQISTGGGKSECFKICAARIKRPTLFLTTRKSLMYQMAEEYERSMKTGIGIIGDGEWNPRPDGVNFAIVGTLASRLSKINFREELEKAVEKHVASVEVIVKKELEKRGLPSDISIVRSIPASLKEKVERVRALVFNKMPIDRDKLAQKVEEKVNKHEAKRKEAIQFLSGIEFLCLEEAHEVSGNGFYTVSNACKNAWYRLALTATPFMRGDNQCGNMQLMAASGSIGIRVTEKELIDRGILARPFFKRISTPRPEGIARGTYWSKAYTLGIVNNSARNIAVAKECRSAKENGLTSMVLVQQVKHGELIKSLLNQIGIRVDFIKGNDSQADRKASLDRLKSGEIDTLIGTTILDVGVDVPSVGMIILAGGGKAEISLRQRIGRGLRAKKDRQNVAFIVDFTDHWNNHTLKHAKSRFAIVDATPGFAENVVDQFPFDEPQ